MKTTLNDLINAKGVSEPLRAAVKALQKENEELRARIEAMVRQEPVAWARKLGLDVPSFGCVTDLKYRPSDIPESSYIPLYILPGAQPAPNVPEGWKLVPIEPTFEMLDKGLDQSFGYVGVARDVWAAMLAAAPNERSEYPEAKP